MKLHLLAPFLTISILGCLPKSDQTSDVLQETDDRTTPKSAQLIEVGPRLNDYMNRIIEKARLEVNPDRLEWTPVRRTALFKAVAKSIESNRKGSGIGFNVGKQRIEISALTDIEAELFQTLKAEKNEILPIKFADSRYGKNKVGISINRPLSMQTKGSADHSISPVLRLNGTIVGLDKIGHFAQQGYWYMDAKLRGTLTSYQERWQFGQFTEGDPALSPDTFKRYRGIYGYYCKACVILGGFGYYGMASTGVISFADMNANESGYKFYQALWDRPQDYTFDIFKIDTKKWNEEVVPNQYRKSLVIEPAKDGNG
jgi:hypothetical protein